MNLLRPRHQHHGRIVQTFEDNVRRDVPQAHIAEVSRRPVRFIRKPCLSRPASTVSDIVLKDTTNGNVGVVNARLAVPRFEDDNLSSSTLILADQISRVSAHDIGLGQFVLGDMKVRPKLDSSFTPSDSMGVFLQVYNLKTDEKTHKADASVQFRVTRDKETTPVLSFNVEQNKLPEHGEELTLENMITLGSLTPGKYKLEVAITDNIAKQTITPVAEFIVKRATAPFLLPLPSASSEAARKVNGVLFSPPSSGISRRIGLRAGVHCKRLA